MLLSEGIMLSTLLPLLISAAWSRYGGRYCPRLWAGEVRSYRDHQRLWHDLPFGFECATSNLLI